MMAMTMEDIKQDEKKGKMEKRGMLINCSNQSKWLNFNQLTMQLDVMGVCVREGWKCTVWLGLNVSDGEFLETLRFFNARFYEGKL